MLKKFQQDHNFFIGGRFPGHQLLDEVEQALAGRIVGSGVLAERKLFPGCHEFGMGLGVIYQRCEDHGAASSQRSARPPQGVRGGWTFCVRWRR